MIRCFYHKAETVTFSLQFLEKSSNINFKENPSVGAELFRAYGRTDRRDEANGRFSQFSKPA
jgi:hypothetical protein